MTRTDSFSWTVVGVPIWDVDDDNLDVHVDFDGGRYVPTFFTVKNVQLWEECRYTGEYGGGQYFWSSDMIIVEHLTQEVIDETIETLMNTPESRRLIEYVWGIDEEPGPPRTFAMSWLLEIDFKTAEPNDSVTVDVVFSNDERYRGTFMTLASAQRRIEESTRVGTCFVWARNIVLLRTLSRETIESVVAAMIRSDELDRALRPATSA